MKKVILASQNQYGYFTIYFNYAKFLSKYFRVIYICFDQGEKKFQVPENVSVIYVPNSRIKIIRFWNYYHIIFRSYESDPDTRILLKYYFFSSLLNFFIKRSNIILDIRTGYTSESRIKTAFYNSIIKFESLFFKRIVTLSESLQIKLRLQGRKTTIIPLGAEHNNIPLKTFQKITLLYVGTISSRNIYQTVEGLSEFLSGREVKSDIEYYIIGGGNNSDCEQLNITIEKLKLDRVVHFEGPVYGEELERYFNLCNIGVSYIPMTRDYDCQPPTKTIEYLMAGMPVIGTATSENKRMISPVNGVLVDDNAKSFAQGLRTIYNQRENFISETIMESVKYYSYNYIVNNKLIPLLTSK